MRALKGILVAGVLAIGVYLGAVFLGERGDGEAALPQGNDQAPRSSEARGDALSAGKPENPELAPPRSRDEPRTEVTHASLESWIASLPPSQRKRARDFAASYGPAYLVSREIEFKWLLANGFPSLEEVVAFEPAMLENCVSHGCRNGKLSALGADYSMNRLESILARAYPDAALPEDYLGNLTGQDRQEFLEALVATQGYTRNAKDNDSILFASYLRARLGRMLGNDLQVDGAEAFIAACGDTRMRPGNPSAYPIAQGMMESLPGSVCGHSPTRPSFPD